MNTCGTGEGGPPALTRPNIQSISPYRGRPEIDPAQDGIVQIALNLVIIIAIALLAAVFVLLERRRTKI